MASPYIAHAALAAMLCCGVATVDQHHIIIIMLIHTSDTLLSFIRDCKLHYTI